MSNPIPPASSAEEAKIRMKIRPLISHALVFATGLVTAWVLRMPGGCIAGNGAGSDPAGPSVTRTPRTTAERESHKSRIEALHRNFTQAANVTDPKGKTELLGGMNTADFLPLIERIIRDAGCTGMDHQARFMVAELVTAWSERDLDGALAWADGFSNPHDRQRMLNLVVEAECGRNLKRGIELVLRYCREKNGNWDIPTGVWRPIVSMEPESLVRTLGSLIAKNKSSVTQIGILPLDYDFRQALDGLAGIQAGLKNGGTMALMPGGLLSEWTRRDPSAAWEWIKEGKKVPHNTLEDFLAAYCENASAEQSVQMVVNATKDIPNVEERYRSAWLGLVKHADEETLEDFMTAMPGNRADHAARLLAVGMRNLGGEDQQMLKSLLLSQMTPQERVASLRGGFAEHGCPQEVREFFYSELRRLGHEEQEIQQLLPQPPIKVGE